MQVQVIQAFGFVLLVLGMTLATLSIRAEEEPSVALWTRFETVLRANKSYANPLQDVQVEFTLLAPSGRKVTVDGFWSGAQRFSLRFSPDELGEWRWSSQASDPSDDGLHGRSGLFRVTPYEGTNPLYRHGALRLTKDRRRLEHADGAPFFWLADTAWAGPLLSDAHGFEAYLRDRVAKRFTTIQFMGTQNIAAAADATGRQAFHGREKIAIEPEFFDRLDERFEAINAAGLLASPTFAWAASWAPAGEALDPGFFLPDDQLILFGRYFVARYGAHQVLWMFGGDIDYRGPLADRWLRLGRAIFGETPSRLVTLHPAPHMLLAREFGSEPWMSFLGYQSGHSNDASTHTWMTRGEPAVDWKSTPLPVINIEPNYENHRDFVAEGKLHGPFDVRRAAYWSVLVSPTAGVSYGAHGVWSWESRVATPFSHSATGPARPWFEAMHLPGSTQMGYLADVLTTARWWTLVPAQELLVEQPGDRDISRFVAAARAEDGHSALVYVPKGDALTLDLAGLGGKAAGRWFDPASGRFCPGIAIVQGRRASVTPPPHNADGDLDFVLVLDAVR